MEQPAATAPTGRQDDGEEEEEVFIVGKRVKVEEDRVTEFKEVTKAADTVNHILRLVPKYVNAFLNTDGGRILFGVSDDGVVVGLPFDRKQKDTLRLRVDSAIDSFRPQVDPDLWSLRFIPVLEADGTAAALHTTADSDDDDMFDPPAVPSPPVEPLVTPALLASSSGQTSRQPVFIEVQHSLPIPMPTVQRARAMSLSTPGSSPFGTPILAEGPTSLYIIELAVMRGRAPIYFTTVRGKGSKAFVRLDGSVHEMTDGMITERKSLGRLAARSATMRTRNKAFIGRVAEMQQVRAFVDEHLAMWRSASADDLSKAAAAAHLAMPPMVVVLQGSPLVGKSSLAKQLVAEFRLVFPDRQLAVDLRGGGHSVQDAMMSVVRVLHPTVPFPHGDLEMRGMYESCFREQRCVLLIEDAETLDQIRTLLPATARSLLAIVTTRFSIPGLDVLVDSMLTLRLGALHPDDAVQLLQSMAPYTLQLDPADRKLALRLCQLCSNMPVPIRLVAGMLASQPQASRAQIIGIIRQLESDPSILSDLVAPFLSLSGVDWHAEAAAVFPDTFDGAAAAFVFGSTSYDDAMSELAKLVKSSLLDFDPLSGRYFMSEIVRAHCVTLSTKKHPQDLLVWKQRFVEHCTQLVVAAKQKLAGSLKDKAEAAQMLQTEQSSIEAALKMAKQFEDDGAAHKKLSVTVRPLLEMLGGSRLKKELA